MQYPSHLLSCNSVTVFKKGLFDGKIGKLAKELADELSGDLMHMFGEDGEGENGPKSTQDVLKKMMKNPKKIMDLLKKE